MTAVSIVYSAKSSGSTLGSANYFPMCDGSQNVLLCSSRQRNSRIIWPKAVNGSVIYYNTLSKDY